jgi:hypothetical protein
MFLSLLIAISKAIPSVWVWRNKKKQELIDQGVTDNGMKGD